MNWLRKFLLVFCCSVSIVISPCLSVTADAVSSKKTAVSNKKKTTKKVRKITTKKTAKKTTKKVAKKVIAKGVKAQKVTASSAKKKKSASRQIRRNTASVKVKKAGLVASSVAATTREAKTGSLARRITARSAMVMDADTGATIYAQDADTPRQPASTIKVLTGVISLDALNKNELVTVSRNAASMPASKVHLVPGKRYPANDLINAVLLASANDASVALAERIGGSETSFARLMTAKARSFGATKTVCKTANGLTASGQYTTAHDLALIFKSAMRHPRFAEKLAVATLKNTDGRIVRSHNRALWLVDGAEGGKTGYTAAARKTYVGKFKRDSDEIIVSLMGSETMWEDVKKLVEYGFAQKQKALALTARADYASDSQRVVQVGSPSRHLAVAPSL
ncbi:MAG: serine hydrolase [Desulfobulbaceae bacterium]|nr:serine hydrolase [Desulfobulbaceae bacterium]